MPGTRPRTSRFIVVILRPPSTRSSAQTASTVSFSGGDPAVLSVFENAIAKRVAWAAAISSSGLVLPSERSVREANVTGRSPTAPLPTWTRPDPCVRLPSQTTSARRSASAIVETLLSHSNEPTRHDEHSGAYPRAPHSNCAAAVATAARPAQPFRAHFARDTWPASG